MRRFGLPLSPRRAVAGCFTLCWLACFVTPLFALDVQPQLGWNSAVRLGRWNVATATVTLAAPGQVQLVCLTLDNEGHTAAFEGSEVTAAAGQILLHVPFQVGRPDADIDLLVLVDQQVVWQRTYRPAADEGWTPLVLSDRLVVSIGKPRGVAQQALPTGVPSKAGLHIVELTANELPKLRSQYEAVDWLILAGDTVPPEGTLATIREWVQDGGRLLVSFPAVTNHWTSSPLRTWLPVTIGADAVTARELSAIEAFAERNIRMPPTNRLEIPKFTSFEGLTLAVSREDVLLARVPWGFGEVLLLALDLTRPPLATWGGTEDFVRKCLATDHFREAPSQTASKTAIGPLTSNGISDYSSQLQAAQDDFARVRRPAPWWSMAWLLALLALVGPLDYLVVHKLLQRPRWTWVTLPLCLLAVSAYAASTGGQWNHGALQVNQLDIIDIDTSSARSHTRSWQTIYSPETGRVQCQLRPAAGPWEAMWPATSPGSQLTGWFAIPETSTGGLYRPGGGEWGKTDYRIQPETGQFEELPILQWSSRTLAERWSGSAQQVAESNLRNTGLGRLTGDFHHNLPGPLTDWLLAYGGRVYRLQKSRNDEQAVPLEPGTTLSTENPLFLQADLRSFLTRIVVSREPTERRVSEQRLVRAQGQYDLSDRDPARLWQMLTFQRQAGGKGYTGLTNDWLSNDDFTRQLDLGRAVLFGRLEAPPAAELTVNGQTVTPDRTDIFVRLVFPVRRSGEIVRQLPKFDKDK